MIQRHLTDKIREMAAKMPVITITGPRQSGKTTLAKACFPHYSYVNLENPDTYQAAISDPRLFLTQFQKGLIIDEAQRLPELFSYIQTISDERNTPGEYILTGSQNFLLAANISQSLAGRVFITHLLPFSITELKQTPYDSQNFEISLFNGFYPRLYDKNIEPSMFYPSYIQTYIERDVRQIVNVSNLFLFQRFMRLSASRVGQLLNYNSIANELGIDLKTVKSWFSILESSFIVFFLQPHYLNFSKRIVKTPKLYFYDTGLVCSLLGIKKADELESHWARGALFENLIMSDLAKNYYNRAEKLPLYFWRDSTGNEIDCLIEEGNTTKIAEIKWSTTISPDFFKGLNYYRQLNPLVKPYLLYGGIQESVRKESQVLSWKSTNELLK
jgi:predicted AAA+ superfamily ATPase